MYRFALPPDRQRDFERYVEYFDGSIGSYARDITFLLGFYVSLVAKRWWEQYRLLPWPDNLAMMLSGECTLGHVLLSRPTHFLRWLVSFKDIGNCSPLGDDIIFSMTNIAALLVKAALWRARYRAVAPPAAISVFASFLILPAALQRCCVA